MGDGLEDHVIGAQCAYKRDALGCAEGQIEPVHTARSPKGRPYAPLGVTPSSSQRATTSASASAR